MNICRLPLIFLLLPLWLGAQTSIIDGYTFESENRGYLHQVEITAYVDAQDTPPIAKVFSDSSGHFVLEVPAGKRVFIKARKSLFHEWTLDTIARASEETLYLKVKMFRQPGYLFDVLLVEEADDPKAPAASIRGALIEVFNNTTDKEELVLKDYDDSEFNFTFKRGNHYTIMIRKEGYLTKRMEAYVNVKGCILCFEGIGTIEPNVADNINSDQQHGSLLSTVYMRKATIGSTFKIKNIHYDYDKAYIRPDAAVELDKVVRMLKDNPTLKIELGSHTDSRGRDQYNMKLSQRRAESAVAYIIEQGIEADRIVARGYGESKIINRCVNGVKCSDKEHEENRRTEITITGIHQEANALYKPLSQIIREEKFLQNVMEGESEVVQYKEGDEMPEDLKKFLMEKARNEVEQDAAEAPLNLDTIPEEARIPEGFTGYLLFLESSDQLVSPTDKRYRGLKQIFVRRDEKEKRWKYYTGPFKIYTVARAFAKKLSRQSRFEKPALKLFDGGKEKQ